MAALLSISLGGTQQHRDAGGVESDSDVIHETSFILVVTQWRSEVDV